MKSLQLQEEDALFDALLRTKVKKFVSEIGKLLYARYDRPITPNEEAIYNAKVVKALNSITTEWDQNYNQMRPESQSRIAGNLIERKLNPQQSQESQQPLKAKKPKENRRTSQKIPAQSKAQGSQKNANTQKGKKIAVVLSAKKPLQIYDESDDLINLDSSNCNQLDQNAQPEAKMSQPIASEELKKEQKETLATKPQRNNINRCEASSKKLSKPTSTISSGSDKEIVQICPQQELKRVEPCLTDKKTKMSYKRNRKQQQQEDRKYDEKQFRIELTKSLFSDENNIELTSFFQPRNWSQVSESNEEENNKQLPEYVYQLSLVEKADQPNEQEQLDRSDPSIDRNKSKSSSSKSQSPGIVKTRNMRNLQKQSPLSSKDQKVSPKLKPRSQLSVKSQDMNEPKKSAFDLYCQDIRPKILNLRPNLSQERQQEILSQVWVHEPRKVVQYYKNLSNPNSNLKPDNPKPSQQKPTRQTYDYSQI